jgi:replicative DNA helicase
MAKYEPDEQTKKDKASKLLPLANDLEQYRQDLGNGSKTYRGLVTGFTVVDDLISGLDRFILLAGRSGAGKTTLATQLALGVAKHTPVLFYSLEMGKSEITTMMIQVLAKGLYRNEIELQGNDPNLPTLSKTKLDKAFTGLTELAPNIYIKDATGGIPNIANPRHEKTGELYDDANSIEYAVKTLKAKHDAERVLVVVDSVQDIIVTKTPNETQAQTMTVQELTEVQQRTGATILVLAQKNKSSISSKDNYGDVMGSMSFIHKPNTVLDLITAKEFINRLKDEAGKDKAKLAEAVQLQQDIEADAKDGYAKPVYLDVIKSRHTGTGNIPLQFYGAYGYYEGGKSKRYPDVYNPFEK